MYRKVCKRKNASHLSMGNQSSGSQAGSGEGTSDPLQQGEPSGVSPSPQPQQYCSSRAVYEKRFLGLDPTSSAASGDSANQSSPVTEKRTGATDKIQGGDCASAPVKQDTEDRVSAPVKQDTEDRVSAPVKQDTEDRVSAPVKQDTEDRASAPVKQESVLVHGEGKPTVKQITAPPQTADIASNPVQQTAPLIQKKSKVSAPKKQTTALSQTADIVSNPVQKTAPLVQKGSKVSAPKKQTTAPPQTADVVCTQPQARDIAPVHRKTVAGCSVNKTKQVYREIPVRQKKKTIETVKEKQTTVERSPAESGKSNSEPKTSKPLSFIKGSATVTAGKTASDKQDGISGVKENVVSPDSTKRSPVIVATKDQQSEKSSSLTWAKGFRLKAKINLTPDHQKHRAKQSDVTDGSSRSASNKSGKDGNSDSTSHAGNKSSITGQPAGKMTNCCASAASAEARDDSSPAEVGEKTRGGAPAGARGKAGVTQGHATHQERGSVTQEGNVTTANTTSKTPTNTTSKTSTNTTPKTPTNTTPETPDNSTHTTPDDKDAGYDGGDDHSPPPSCSTAYMRILNAANEKIRKQRQRRERGQSSDTDTRHPTVREEQLQAEEDLNQSLGEKAGVILQEELVLEEFEEEVASADETNVSDNTNISTNHAQHETQLRSCKASQSSSRCKNKRMKSKCLRRTKDAAGRHKTRAAEKSPVNGALSSPDELALLYQEDACKNTWPPLYKYVRDGEVAVDEITGQRTVITDPTSRDQAPVDHTLLPDQCIAYLPETSEPLPDRDHMLTCPREVTPDDVTVEDGDDAQQEGTLVAIGALMKNKLRQVRDAANPLWGRRMRRSKKTHILFGDPTRDIHEGPRGDVPYQNPINTRRVCRVFHKPLTSEVCSRETITNVHSDIPEDVKRTGYKFSPVCEIGSKKELHFTSEKMSVISSRTQTVYYYKTGEMTYELKTPEVRPGYMTYPLTSDEEDDVGSAKNRDTVSDKDLLFERDRETNIFYIKKRDVIDEMKVTAPSQVKVTGGAHAQKGETARAKKRHRQKARRKREAVERVHVPDDPSIPELTLTDGIALERLYGYIGNPRDPLITFAVLLKRCPPTRGGATSIDVIGDIDEFMTSLRTLNPKLHARLRALHETGEDLMETLVQAIYTIPNQRYRAQDAPVSSAVRHVTTQSRKYLERIVSVHVPISTLLTDNPSELTDADFIARNKTKIIVQTMMQEIQTGADASHEGLKEELHKYTCKTDKRAMLLGHHTAGKWLAAAFNCQTMKREMSTQEGATVHCEKSGGNGDKVVILMIPGLGEGHCIKSQHMEYFQRKIDEIETCLKTNSMEFVGKLMSKHETDGLSRGTKGWFNKQLESGIKQRLRDITHQYETGFTVVIEFVQICMWRMVLEIYQIEAKQSEEKLEKESFIRDFVQFGRYDFISTGFGFVLRVNAQMQRNRENNLKHKKKNAAKTADDARSKCAAPEVRGPGTMVTGDSADARDVKVRAAEEDEGHQSPGVDAGNQTAPEVRAERNPGSQTIPQERKAALLPARPKVQIYCDKFVSGHCDDFLVRGDKGTKGDVTHYVNTNKRRNHAALTPPKMPVKKQEPEKKNLKQEKKVKGKPSKQKIGKFPGKETAGKNNNQLSKCGANKYHTGQERSKYEKGHKSNQKSEKVTPYKPCAKKPDVSGDDDVTNDLSNDAETRDADKMDDRHIHCGHFVLHKIGEETELIEMRPLKQVIPSNILYS